MRYDQPMEKDTVFTLMGVLGVTKIHVGFSGGHDEGGCDNIQLTLKDGKVESVSEPWGSSTKNMSERDRMVEMACTPVYQRYYSFAGEYYVNGEVVWDLEARTVKMNGSEEVPSYEVFDEEL